MKNKFKNGLTLLFLLLTTLFFAQTKGISYQAVIYKPDTKVYPGVAPNASPFSNAPVCLQFTFLDSSNSIEYQETIKVTTDTFGIVKTTIGLGSQTGGYATSFASISWNSNEKILITSLDLSSSCSAFEEISRQSFGSAPFAFSAVTAENISGVAAITNGGTGATTAIEARMNLGLNNIDNTSDLNKPISNASQLALNTKEDSANKSTDGTLTSNSNVKFPTEKAVKTYVDSKVTASTVVDADASTKGKIQLAGDLGGTAGAPTVPGLANKENTIAAGTTTQYFRGDKSWQTLDKTAVGLANLDNTTDLNKPISTATQTALDTKEATANKSLNVVTDAASDEKFPSVKAVKTYVDEAKTVSDIVTKTGDYTVVAANSTILCDASTAAFTLTLPDPATVTGRTLVINKIDESSNILTITPALSLTTATTIGSVNYPASFKVQSNGTNWYIIK